MTESYRSIMKRAKQLIEAGDLAGAVAAYREAVTLAPQRPDAHYELALLHHSRGEIADAVAAFQKVVELAPQDASAWNNLGVLHYGQSDWGLAEHAFRQAVLWDGRYADAWYGLAKTLLKQERKPEAAQSLHTCLRWEPGHGGAKKALDALQPSPIETPAANRFRVGFVSLWFERGQAYVTRMLREVVAQEQETFVLARNGGTPQAPMLATTGEWAVPNLTTYPEYRIDHDFFQRWVSQNRLDVVFFNEEYDLGLVQVAKQAGARTIGFYEWELFDPALVPGCNALYDRIICQTDACYRKYATLEMNNLTRIKWGVDRSLFKPGETRSDGRVRFFHPAGWGGMHARRGTQFVIDAFRKANLQNAELLIHTQHGKGREQDGNITLQHGTVPREELVRMYQEADVAVLPSKWEGLGLTFLEAIGCGLPIITVDAPPMNEFVRDGETGLLCRVVEHQRYDGIFVEGAHVDVDDMAEKMRLLTDAQLCASLRERTEELADEFSMERFRDDLLHLLRDVTAGLDGVRLNIGCGADIRQGYINVDFRQMEGVDQVTDVAHLPYADETVSELLANDILEHFPRARTEEVLAEWIRVLKPGGVLKLQCPDVRALAYALVTNQVPVQEFSRRIYGGQDYAGNLHYAGFDIPAMKRLLRSFGMWPTQVATYNGNLGITAVRNPHPKAKNPRIILISARLSNYPWGTGNFIHKALTALGHEVVDIDFRRDREHMEELLQQPADLVIAYKASGINPRLLEMKSCPTVLWYPDDVHTVQHARNDLQASGYAYDYVYYFDQAGLSTLQRMGIAHSSFLPLATDPTVYRYIPGTKKKYDVAFVGSVYPNRRALLDRLKEKFNVLETKAFMEDMVRIFNEAKIVLNLGVGNSGYPLRVFEALGSRSFLLTNEIREGDTLFRDREHLVYFNDENIEDLIEYYLEHDDEREAIAQNGYEEVVKKHTFGLRIEKILQDVGRKSFTASTDSSGVSTYELKQTALQRSVQPLPQIEVARNATLCHQKMNDLPEKMPIIFISVDGLRHDYLGYNNEKVGTPTINELAQDGVVFTRATTVGVVTTMAHICMLTGTVAEKNGVLNLPNYNPRCKDIFTKLSEVDYKTKAFAMYGMILEYPYKYWHLDKNSQFEGAADFPEVHLKVMDWIQRNYYEKFFLFLHYWKVHTPYGLELDNVGQNKYGAENIREIVRLIETGELSLEDVRASYRRQIRSVSEDHLKPILDHLKQKGVYDKSLVILTADHGEGLGYEPYDLENYRNFTHNRVNESVVRVPLVIKFPKSMNTVTGIIDEPVTHLDILPTIYSLIPGITFSADEEELDGRNLLPLLTNTQSSHENAVAVNEKDDAQVVGADDSEEVQKRLEALGYL